jgi:DNA polymerase (family 10)
MKRIAGADEKEIYRLFGMDYIEPELRENRGEIEAAAEGKLPLLVSENDIRGDLHCRMVAGGMSGAEKMILAAKRKGYLYIAFANRLGDFPDSRASVEKYLETLKSLQKRHSDIHVIAGIEVDILKDGSLGAEDRLLENFDLVAASVSDHFDMDGKSQTHRVIRALSHPMLRMLSSPTGRIIGRRRALALDMERIAEAASDRGVWLEIDARPDRSDPGDATIRKLSKYGAIFAVNSCAESAGEMENIRYGMDQARRGWPERTDIVNTADWQTLEKSFKGT